MGGFVAYYRVSTQKQGTSGLGLEAQREAVRRYLTGSGQTLVIEFTEVETGKATKQRPELIAALRECKRREATLVIGKLDRLARDVRYFLEVLDDYGVDIRFAEFADIDPKTDEGRMVLISMANFAEFEGRRISSRTKAALAAAKSRGVQLGTAGRQNIEGMNLARRAAADAFANKLRPVICGLQALGLSQRDLVRELNGLDIPAAGGGKWSLSQVQRVLSRLHPKQMDGVRLE